MTLEILTFLAIALAFAMPIASSPPKLIPFILNGTIAEKGAFPYFARIEVIHGDNHKTKCGASIISKRFLITSLDCVEREHEKINAYFGIVAEDEYESSAIIEKHRVFSAEGSELALLLMSDPIQFSDNVQPINLPEVFMVPEYLMNQEVLVTGMGYYQRNESSKNLRYANMRIFSLVEMFEHPKCSKDWMKKEICLAREDGFIMAYTGDSGDPVTLETDDKKYLVGVVNARLGEKYNTAIAIYPYLAWITIATRIHDDWLDLITNNMN